MSFAAVDTISVRPGMVTDRQVPVPDFYVPHTDLSLPVLVGGRATGFQIGSVAPERRWPIAADGAVISQARFEEMYVRIGKHETCDYVPAVDDYVSKGVDPTQPERLVRLRRRDKTFVKAVVEDSSPIVDPATAARLGLSVTTEPLAPKTRELEQQATEQDSADEFQCSDCDFTGKNSASLSTHRRHKHRPEEVDD